MIKINLIGDRTSSDFNAHFQVAIFALSLAIVIIFGWTYAAHLDYDIAYLKQSDSILRAHLSELKKQTKTVRDLEKKREVLRSKLAVIDDLKKRKVGPVKVLDQLNSAIPEKSWLLEVRDKGGVLRIDGLALDNQTIADFINQLEKSALFQRVDLLEARQEEVRGVKMKHFAVSAKITYGDEDAATARDAL
jgi:type IV pilus assembly protein PilN